MPYEFGFARYFGFDPLGLRRGFRVFDFEDFHICDRGLQIKTRWFFDPGAELSINFQWSDADGNDPRILKTQGIVADCERCAESAGYRVTVVFLEVTADIRAAIEELTNVLA